MRTEAEIRAEINRLKRDIPVANRENWASLDILVGRRMALEWVLNEPEPGRVDADAAIGG